MESFIDTEESSEGDLHYEEIEEINDEMEEGLEWETWKVCLEEIKGIDTGLKNMKLLPEPIDLPKEVFGSNMAVDPEKLNRIFKLFLLNKKKDSLAWDRNLYAMDTYSLFYRYLVIQFLDPSLEIVSLSTLGLYLLDYKVKCAPADVSNVT